MDAKDKCQEPVTKERFWPGKEPDYVCDAHARDTTAIANALQTRIPMRAFVGKLAESVECACSVGHPQTIHVESS